MNNTICPLKYLFRVGAFIEHSDVLCVVLLRPAMDTVGIVCKVLQFWIVLVHQHPRIYTYTLAIYPLLTSRIVF